MHCPCLRSTPLPSPFNPWWGNGDGTPSQASRCRRCCSVAGAADRKWVHHIDRFFSPRCVLHFFSVFLLATFFYAMWQRAVWGGGRRKVGLGSLGCCRSLYMCVSAVCVGVWVFIIFRLRKILCAHTNTHTHTLTHTPAPTKNCERNNWHRLMALTSTALPAATAASSLSPFGPKKKKNSRENE